MEIILLERIEKLGQMGDVVTVKPGYARNYLLPQRKALRKTRNNLSYFETRRAQLEADNLSRRAEAEEIATRMEGLTVPVLRAAGDGGQLYGSVNARDIAVAIVENGVNINRQQVVLDRALKHLGLEQIRIQLHPEIAVHVTVNIARNAEEAERQRQLGRAVGTGDEFDDDDEIATAEEAAPRDDPQPDADTAEGSQDDIEQEPVG